MAYVESNGVRDRWRHVTLTFKHALLSRAYLSFS